jgi:hypothetical protein
VGRRHQGQGVTEVADLLDVGGHGLAALEGRELKEVAGAELQSKRMARAGWYEPRAQGRAWRLGDGGEEAREGNVLAGREAVQITAHVAAYPGVHVLDARGLGGKDVQEPLLEVALRNDEVRSWVTREEELGETGEPRRHEGPEWARDGPGAGDGDHVVVERRVEDVDG